MPQSTKYRWVEAGKDLLAWAGIDPARELNTYLVRHMKTEANAKPFIHRIKADKAIQVLPEERQGGEDAARFLAERLYTQYRKSPHKFGTILVLISPYERTQESALPHLYYLNKLFGADSGIIRYKIDDRLIELRIGLRDGLRGSAYTKRYRDAAKNHAKHIKFDSQAYASSPMGEAFIELSWRLRHVQQDILNNYERENVRHCIIVGHGGTNRAFVQSWMNYNPQWIISEDNPGNNWIRHIKGTPRNGIIVDPRDFVDCGYIFGRDAPLNDPQKTQKFRKEATQSFVLQPQRPDDIIPPGTRVINPLTSPWRT